MSSSENMLCRTRSCRTLTRGVVAVGEGPLRYGAVNLTTQGFIRRAFGSGRFCGTLGSGCAGTLRLGGGG